MTWLKSITYVMAMYCLFGVKTCVFLFSFFVFQLIYLLLEGVVESFLLFEDELLTPDIDRVTYASLSF